RTSLSLEFLAKSITEGTSARSGCRVRAICIRTRDLRSRTQSGLLAFQPSQSSPTIPCTSPRSIARAMLAVPTYPDTSLIRVRLAGQELAEMAGDQPAVDVIGAAGGGRHRDGDLLALEVGVLRLHGVR